MALISVPDDDPRVRDAKRANVGIISYGGALVGNALISMAKLEQVSGYYTYQLFDGGLIAGSGGFFPAMAALLPHPDGSEKPLMTMSEFADPTNENGFFYNLPFFLPPRPNHHKWQILKSISPRPMKLSLHYDRTQKEEVTKKILGEHTTLKDLRRSFCGHSHRISQEVEGGKVGGRNEPYDFYRIEDSVYKKRCGIKQARPEQDIPLYQIGMAMTAYPSVFKHYHIPDLRSNFIDTAITANSLDNLIMFADASGYGSQMDIVRFGAGRDNDPIGSERYAKMGILDMVRTRFIFDTLGLDAQIRGRVGLRFLFGQESFMNFDVPFKPIGDETKESVPTIDALDTSSENIERMINHAWLWVDQNEDMFKRVSERLVNNMLKNAPCDPLCADPRTLERQGRNQPELPVPANDTGEKKKYRISLRSGSGAAKAEAVDMSPP